MIGQIASHCRSRFARVARGFGREEQGAVALEFALIAMPFFGLIVAILHTSLSLFAGQVLQTKVLDAGRLIMTGQMTGKSLNDFKLAVCNPDQFTLFNCDKLRLQVSSFTDFNTADPTHVIADCFDPEKPPVSTTCFKPGKEDDVVIIRAAYEWPFGLNFMDDGTQMLVATAAVHNEPFQATP